MLVDEKVTCEGCSNFEECEQKGATFSAEEINAYEEAALRAFVSFKEEVTPDVV